MRLKKFDIWKCLKLSKLKIRFTRNEANILATIPYKRKKFIKKNSKLLLVKYISCRRFRSVTVDEKKNS